MFNEKEIKYLKEIVYSDLEGNCIPPLNDNMIELPYNKFPDLSKDEIDFVKNLYNKISKL